MALRDDDATHNQDRVVLCDPPTRRLLVRQSSCSFFAQTSSIAWIEALGNYVRLHVSYPTHMIQASLAAMERKLDPAEFMRLHRSTILKLDRIDKTFIRGAQKTEVLRDIRLLCAFIFYVESAAATSLLPPRSTMGRVT